MIAISHALFTLVSLTVITARASRFTPTPTAKEFEQTGWELSKGNNYGAPLPPWADGATPGWYHCPKSASTNCKPGIPCLQYGTPLCNLLSYFPDSIPCPKPSSTSRDARKQWHAVRDARTRRPHAARGSFEGDLGGDMIRRQAARGSFEGDLGGDMIRRQGQPSSVPTPDPYHATFTNFNGAINGNDYITFGMVDTVEACKAMCDGVQGCNFANTYHDVNGKDGSPLLTCTLFMSCYGIEFATNTGGQTQPNGLVNYIAESDGWCKL